MKIYIVCNENDVIETSKRVKEALNVPVQVTTAQEYTEGEIGEMYLATIESPICLNVTTLQELAPGHKIFAF